MEGEAGHDLDFGTDCWWSALSHPLLGSSSWRSGGACRTRRDDQGLFGAKKFFEARFVHLQVGRAIDLPRSSSIVVLHVKFIFAVCVVVSTAFGPRFSSLLPQIKPFESSRSSRFYCNRVFSSCRGSRSWQLGTCLQRSRLPDNPSQSQRLQYSASCRDGRRAVRSAQSRKALPGVDSL